MLDGTDPAKLLRLMTAELLIGATIGLMGRVFFIALETLGMALSMSIGLSSNLGAPIDEESPLPAVTTALTLAATALMFLTDLHLEVFKALASSYRNMPVGGGYAPQAGLVQIVDMTGRAFTVSLRIVSPFLVFSIVVNFSVGLTNRLGAERPGVLLVDSLPDHGRPDSPLFHDKTDAGILHRSLRPVPGERMKERLRSMRRVLGVQDQLKRVAEWRLTAAQNRKLDLEAEARQLDGFIDRAGLARPAGPHGHEAPEAGGRP